MNSWRTIKARGDYFLSDPSAIGHVCSPVQAAGDKLRRIAYEKVQEVKVDQIYFGRVPRQVYEEMLEKANEEYDDEVMKALYGWGFGMKRRAISRAINTWKDREVTLENIPENLAKLSDGKLFVQEQDAGLHIYYSEKTIEIACKTGLYAIVADGVHTKQHKELAQLYCVHGICDGGIEIPLLYSMTARKTEDTYLKIFGHLKNLFKIHRPRPIQPLRIVLDYEKASIAAVWRLFPYSEIEGCAFHLAQAWNRRKDTCNLRKFIQGRCKQSFLIGGTQLKVPALWSPPVPQNHVAYEKCKEFLEYFHANWLNGPYKDLWNKWKKVALRTTNVAESFHKDHPDLKTLIEKLKYIDFEAKCSLRWIRENPEEHKHLRKRDRERRENIEKSMNRFDELYRLRGVTRSDIENYCRYMSRYVSGKTI